MPTPEHEEHREEMLRLFADIDPWGLIGIGAPEDEYAPEVDDLIGRAEVTADDVAETFRRFGAPGGAPWCSRADARRIADGVERLRRGHA